MKKYAGFARAAAVVAAVSLSISAPQVHAVTLVPGGVVFPAVAEVDPIGGTLVASLSSPFASAVMSGTLVSSVFSGDTANPYGGLTFTYQFNISALSTDAASQISISSFDSLLTDVSFRAGSGVPVTVISRSDDGHVVRFSYLLDTINPGQESALMVVQTSATLYSPTTAAIINGESINVPSLAPLTVPEPSAAGLLLAGLGLVGWRLRRKQ